MSSEDAMLFIEGSVFFLFIGGFCAWLLLSHRLREWRDRKESDRVSALVTALRGNPISEVVDRFGPPREFFEGSSGRSLYVWRSPPSAALPRVRGLLVLTLTVDHGRVVESNWQLR
jgi:hypothetical protein